MLVVVAWLLALGLAGPSEPVVEGVSLQWNVPPGCPDALTVRQRIEALANDADDAVAADVVVTGDGTRFVAEVTVSGSQGGTHRQLQAATCEEIAEAVAVIVTVHRPTAPPAGEPKAVATADVAADEPPPLVPSAIAAEPKRTDDPPPARAAPRSTAPAATDDGPPPVRQRRLRGAVWVEGSLAAGGLPLGASVGGGVGLLGPRFRAELAGRYRWARDASPTGPRARVGLTTVAVRAGPVFTLGPLELVARAAFEAGLARGVGRGVDVSHRSARPWLAAGVAPALLWPVRPRVALGITGELLGVVMRPRFAVDGVGTVFIAGYVAGGAGLTAEIRFP